MYMKFVSTHVHQWILLVWVSSVSVMLTKPAVHFKRFKAKRRFLAKPVQWFELVWCGVCAANQAELVLTAWLVLRPPPDCDWCSAHN